ncbi:CopD family protein [Zoogloea oleivorans]|uniref:CopD family protein n=1 Tax=Zoogloea oleivorans TaxID=1552750 RepID=UPI00165284E2|nr:CopD family protein [Zoogloea oleivorans]
MKLHHILLFAHLAGVIVWVGGMAFAHFCLRPAALPLPPAQRLGLWSGVFGRFFPIVWLAIAVIVVSGFAMLVEVGFAQAPRSWHVMAAVGLVMAGIFASIWFGPWRALQQAVAAESWAQGAQALNLIRQRVTINLVLGVLTVLLATLGLAF